MKRLIFFYIKILKIFNNFLNIQISKLSKKIMIEESINKKLMIYDFNSSKTFHDDENIKKLIRIHDMLEKKFRK